MTARLHFRRLRMGLATLLGLRRQGFFIPYRYADGLPGADARGPYRALSRRFDAARATFADMLAAMDGHGAEFQGFSRAAPPAPRWEQDWFPRLDGAAAYAMVRRHRPARIIEVGSGHSTRFMARAVADGDLGTEILAIDPAPRAAIDALPITIDKRTLHQAGTGPFAALEAGDILFIDSSHILMPGTDVDLLFSEILPALPAGVIIHIHDIFLPDDYPPSWDWRGYNEQQGVAALLAGGGFDLLFASHYVATYMQDELAGTALAGLPLPDGAHESSLWLRKINPAE